MESQKTYSFALILLNSSMTRTPFYMTPLILTKEKHTGTEDGLDQCVAKLKEIEMAVQKDSISMDKPGMKKFILQEKGSKCEQWGHNEATCGCHSQRSQQSVTARGRSCLYHCNSAWSRDPKSLQRVYSGQRRSFRRTNNDNHRWSTTM